MEGGTVTAGNASSQNDAASVCLVVAEDKLEELGLTASGYLKGWAVTGCHPAYMGIGPVPAVGKLMSKINMSLDDMDLIELNEAFAAQVLSVLREWKLKDEDKLNVNGSGVSLGHPIAATGAPHFDHPALRDGEPERPVRPGDHVRRRRAGGRRCFRAPLIGNSWLPPYWALIV